MNAFQKVVLFLKIIITLLQISFNKSLRNIENTDRMVYTNEENPLI